MNQSEGTERSHFRVKRSRPDRALSLSLMRRVILLVVGAVTLFVYYFFSFSGTQKPSSISPVLFGGTEIGGTEKTEQGEISQVSTLSVSSGEEEIPLKEEKRPLPVSRPDEGPWITPFSPPEELGVSE